MTDRAPTHSPAWRNLTEHQKGTLLRFAAVGDRDRARDLLEEHGTPPEHLDRLDRLLREANEVEQLAARAVLRRFEADVAREHEAYHAQLAVDALAAVLRLVDEYRLFASAVVRVRDPQRRLGDLLRCEPSPSLSRAEKLLPGIAVLVDCPLVRVSPDGPGRRRCEATATVAYSVVRDALVHAREVTLRLALRPDRYVDFCAARGDEVHPVLSSRVDYAVSRSLLNGDVELVAGWKEEDPNRYYPKLPHDVLVLAERYYPTGDADLVRGHGSLHLPDPRLVPGAVVRFQPLAAHADLYADFRFDRAPDHSHSFSLVDRANLTDTVATLSALHGTAYGAAHFSALWKAR